MKVNGMRPILLVVDFDGCFRFYRDTMGLKPAFGKEGDSYATLVADGGSRLSLFKGESMADVVGLVGLPRPEHQDRFLLTFDVSDIEAVMEVLKVRGAHFITPLIARPDWGIRTIFLRDPDGNLVQLEEGMPMSDWTEELRAEVESYRSMTT